MSKLKQTAVALATPVVMLGFLQEKVQAATFRLQEATISEINTAFDSGELTSEQLTQLYLNRIDAYDNQGCEI